MPRLPKAVPEHGSKMAAQDRTRCEEVSPCPELGENCFSRYCALGRVSCWHSRAASRPKLHSLRITTSILRSGNRASMLGSRRNMRSPIIDTTQLARWQLCASEPQVPLCLHLEVPASPASGRPFIDLREPKGTRPGIGHRRNLANFVQFHTNFGKLDRLSPLQVGPRLPEVGPDFDRPRPLSANVGPTWEPHTSACTPRLCAALGGVAQDAPRAIEAGPESEGGHRQTVRPDPASQSSDFDEQRSL